MKKTAIILCVALLCLVVFFLINKRQIRQSIIVAPTNQPSNIVATVVEISTNNATTISKYENISDLNGISSLKLFQRYPKTQSWLSYHVLVPFQINGQDGKELIFEADVVDAEIITTNGRVQSLELQSPYMDITGTRNFGLQLCNALGIDPKDFLAWCDKVGNHWMDQPVFDSRAGNSPNLERTVGFSIRHTFNNEKPWYVDLFFQDR